MNEFGKTTFAPKETGTDAPSKESATASAGGTKGLFWKILTVIRFEMRRTRTDARAATWLIMVLFPAGLLALYRLQARTEPNFEPLDERVLGLVLYGLIPQVVCLLGLLLWVAPMLQAELEGRTWIYLAVRPGGKIAT